MGFVKCGTGKKEKLPKLVIKYVLTASSSFTASASKNMTITLNPDQDTWTYTRSGGTGYITSTQVAGTHCSASVGSMTLTQS